MTAEIVSVGTELLFGQIADTNAQYLGKLLPQLGIAHMHRQTVGDNLERLTDSLKLALERADIVFTIGGLGPTEDDLTRDGIAAALDDELVQDDDVLDRLRNLFRERNLPWVDSQIRQAMRPSYGRPIENPNGTAPGLICEKDGKVVIALPGPKGEFMPMVDGPVKAFLQSISGGNDIIHSHLLRICGIGESIVEEKIRPLLASTNPTIAPYAHLAEVHLRVTAKASNMELAEALIAPAEQRIRAVLGDAVYASGNTTLEAATLDLMKARELRLAVAESISGGGFGDKITSVPGSATVFLGGVISYDRKVKEQLLKVDPKLLDDPKIGPVSAEVAEQMACGVRDLLGSDYAVSLTGNAGPTTDDGDKPVGLVYVGIAHPKGCYVHEFKFRGQREDIRRRAVMWALTKLRQAILDHDEP